MAAESAGLLLYRREEGLAVLLVHPGGPYWRSKDLGAWSIPKGLIGPGEAPLAAACREFEEELGSRPEGDPFLLARIRQAGGKRVTAFALEAGFDPAGFTCNEFEMEWPPRSGRMQRFPEVDQAEWFAMPAAREKILASQLPILDALEARLAG